MVLGDTLVSIYYESVVGQVRIASLGRPAAQSGIRALTAKGFHKPEDAENRLGYYLGQIER